MIFCIISGVISVYISEGNQKRRIRRMSIIRKESDNYSIKKSYWLNKIHED